MAIIDNLIAYENKKFDLFIECGNKVGKDVSASIEDLRTAFSQSDWSEVTEEELQQIYDFIKNKLDVDFQSEGRLANNEFCVLCILNITMRENRCANCIGPFETSACRRKGSPYYRFKQLTRGNFNEMNWLKKNLGQEYVYNTLKEALGY